MNLRDLGLLVGVSLFSVVGAAGCAADTASDAAEGSDEEVAESSEDALTGAPSNTGYVQVTRRDFRKCAAPLCGGYFVKRVNDALTTCADGTKKAECYVSEITYNGIGLSARETEEFHAAVVDGKAFVKAKTYKATRSGIVYGKLKASEGWLGATGSVGDGTFYRAADNGIRCITAPCPSTTVYGLNSADDYNVIRVDLEHTANPADPDVLARAQSALATKEGVMISGGVALPKCLPGSNCGPFAMASEFYLKVERREGKACGGRGQQTCNAGQYCNWTDANICGAFDAPGACSYKPEVCYKIYKPVCGCDGNTYGNDCMAHAAGTSVSSQGACAAAPKP